MKGKPPVRGVPGADRRPGAGQAPRGDRGERRGPAAEGARIPPPSIPHRTRRAFEKHFPLPGQNPGLIFDRYAPDWGERERVKVDGREVTVKQLALEAVCRACDRIDARSLAAAGHRWREVAQAAHAQPFTLKADWRLIAGLGRKGPLEVGFTFHRYGFPILPGSSVKGVARAWVFFLLADLLGESGLERLDRKRDEPPLEALERLLCEPEPRKYQEALAAFLAQLRPEAAPLALDFRAIFGTTGAAGMAVFFDAIPAGKPKLELDIMNPHYPDYYQGSAAPTDWQNPKPVYFLTVAPGSEFRFAVGWRRSVAEGSADARLQEQARQWLIKGLTELGAGAKTSSGYGYFQPAVGSPVAAPAPRAEPAAPRVAPPASTQPQEPLVMRRGTITIIRPDRRFGQVRDAETGREYRFSIEAVEGNMPAKKARVVFETRGGDVVRVRRES